MLLFALFFFQPREKAPAIDRYIMTSLTRPNFALYTMNQIRRFGQSLASVFSETPDSPNETSDLRNETAGSPNETSDTTWGKLETVVQKAKDDREELQKLKENNHKLCETYRDYLRKDLATPDECQSVKNIEEQLQEITGDLERIQKKCSHEVVIEFVGATSSGKSTLINALTREERLPVGFAETTMCVIEVKTIDDEEWSVEVDKKTLSGKKSKESIRALLTAMSQEDFRNERSDLNINERSVVRVGWPKRFSRQLPQNVVLVDSPGYGEDENVDQIVKDSCQKADIIVAVMDSMSPSKAHVSKCYQCDMCKDNNILTGICVCVCVCVCVFPLMSRNACKGENGETGEKSPAAGDLNWMPKVAPWRLTILAKLAILAKIVMHAMAKVAKLAKNCQPLAI